ncbi:MAG: serine/threonine protein kinase [Deltaproteobacteria bacterium]|nr:serine/threonine protein kinase [Deltaproteobacteria bacterium]
MTQEFPRAVAQGRYLLQAEIGQGGTGTVFKASEVQTGQIVAFKRFHSNLAGNAGALSNLQRDIGESQKIDHENLLKVHECATDEEGLYTVCDFSPFGSLADRIERTGPMTPESAVALCLRLGDALSTLHATKLIHRNVKPSNVLLFEGGGAKLSDLGTANLVFTDEMTMELAGSPEYMAPEQRRLNEPSDERTDLYGLAATLHTCLTAEAPGGSAGWRVPHKLRPILNKALSIDPSNRQATVQAFSDEVSRLYSPVRAGGGSKIPLISLVLLALVLIGFALGFLLYETGDEISQPVSTKVAPKVTTKVSTKVTTKLTTTVTTRVKPPVRHKVVAGQVPVTPQAKAVLTDAQTWPNSIGSGYTLAFVKNTGEVPIENPRVDITYHDAEGRKMTTAFGYGSIGLIAPGASSPVKLLIKKFPQGFAGMKATVKARAPYSLAKRTAHLKLDEPKLVRGKYHGHELTAQIRSEETQETIKYAEAIVVLFDAKDRIIDIASGYSKQKELNPGESCTVRVILNPLGDETPVRFQAWADATIYPKH